MFEMQLEEQRPQRLLWQQLGDIWVQAVSTGALDLAAECCRPEVSSVLVTPKRVINHENAIGLVSQLYQWLGECTSFHLEDSRLGQVGERLSLWYRLRVQEQGEWFTLEQQLYATLEQGRIAQLQLLCSGFQPALPGMQEVSMENLGTPGKDPAPDQVLELHTASPGAASTCALLTPMIRSKLREMHSGQVLEVRVDDPAAREDVEAWCRLSGNALLEIAVGQGPMLRFLVRKK